MTAFPTLFVSHGAPNLILHDNPARDCLARLGDELGRPQAILIASAHFEAATPSFCIDKNPGMIYDFQGFEDELYKIVYPAPGLPQLAELAAYLVEQAGIPSTEISGRGFDHGVWVPLALMYPGAEIPVVQMSVQPALGAGHHVALGRALAALRKQNVLVIGSGSLTHNLHEVLNGGYAFDAPAPYWVQDFDDWVLAKAQSGEIEAIAEYRNLAPHARDNHPSEEHFLPLAFAFGAAGEGARGRRIHHSVQRGVMAMDAYLFE
ncbi:DODA-type extradiol aromatic ring-opening family dioxygenase [Methylocapsa palsarum]|uniref:4,5-DOPA dioxygenase extradiol n=1 Tax=Methylocapsa palsarum TaxID=1612308 RepID=A0A1I3ZQC3_9HYPH|nr:class III extradiol ring-cleavage dioxygenase [Methylocapsa palsarum]SFK46193.1 4,5-DOPA dioxygenase extradiol [Methylocapsa palsarum]